MVSPCFGAADSSLRLKSSQLWHPLMRKIAFDKCWRSTHRNRTENRLLKVLGMAGRGNSGVLDSGFVPLSLLVLNHLWVVFAPSLWKLESPIVVGRET